MSRTITALLAAAFVLALVATAPDSKAQRADADRNAAYDNFDKYLAKVVATDDEKAAEEVTKALTERNAKQFWALVAAVEAVRQGEIDSPGAGKRFLPLILNLLKDEKDLKKLHENEILTVNVFACLSALTSKEDDHMLDVVTALWEWQKWSKNKVVRLRDMADRTLLKLTGEDCTLKDETLSFWEWWMRNHKAKRDHGEDNERPPEKQSKTAPIIFKEPMIGTRVVFVIDVSDSMKWPIRESDIPKIKAKAPHLPWDKERSPTPMWVAIEELAHSINQLRPQPKPDSKGKSKGTMVKKDDPEMRHFAVVTYSSEVKMLTPGWVVADNSNCDSWMKDVRGLETEHLTNIHGGLLQAFKLSEKSKDTANFELDAECVLTGAHTIVFLTDGFPTWSNDSESQSQPDEWDRPNMVGDGKYAKRDALIELAIYVNRFRKVLINTVGIGNHDKKLMAAFAKNSGGSYQDWFCEVDWK